MRPVNLIPPEERAGERKPMRGGPLAYIVVGALFAVLLGVTLLVVTNNQISDRKGELATLETETATVQARAQALSAYTQFQSVSEQRATTIASLADSRFDWERVMRELALVLPNDVWITNLSATSNPNASSEGGSSTGLRSGIAGPALELSGCARGQEAVAGFVQALKDIDGVTRVGMQGSSIGESSGGESASVASGSCEMKGSAQFQMVAGFDAAPVSSEETAGG